MQKRKQKWVARHEDDKLWGMGITNMIPNIMQGVGRGHEARENERDMTAVMDGGGLEASQLADTMQKAGPEKHQELQQ